MLEQPAGEGRRARRIRRRVLDRVAALRTSTAGPWRDQMAYNWIFPDLESYAFDTFPYENALMAVRPDASAEIVWRVETGIPECPSPLYVDGRVILVKNGGLATCVDAETGETRVEVFVSEADAGRFQQRFPDLAPSWPAAG